MHFMVDGNASLGSADATVRQFSWWLEDHAGAGTELMRLDVASNVAALTHPGGITGDIGKSGTRWATVWATTLDATTLTLSGDVAAVNGVFTGYVRGGGSTEAVAAGDLSLHTAASGGLFYDASVKSLTLGTDSRLSIGAHGHTMANNDLAVGSGAAGRMLWDDTEQSFIIDLTFAVNAHIINNNTMQYVALAGANSITLGTTSNHQMILKTNDTARATFAAAGGASFGAPGNTSAVGDLSSGTASTSRLLYDDSGHKLEITAAAGNTCRITVAAASGNVTLAATANADFIFQTNGTSRWQLNNSGHFVAVADNTYDFGLNNASRARNFYVANAVNVGDGVDVQTGNGDASFGNGTQNVFLDTSGGTFGTTTAHAFILRANSTAGLTIGTSGEGTFAQWQNTGTTTRAVAQGDGAWGLDAGNQLFYDQSGGILYLRSDNTTNTVQIGATDNRFANDMVVGSVGAAPKSVLESTGSFAAEIDTITGATTLTDQHHTVLCDASGGAFTVTLPAATGITRRIYHIKKVDSSALAVTIDANASETIDGALTAVISTQWNSITIHTDGSNWYIL